MKNVWIVEGKLFGFYNCFSVYHYCYAKAKLERLSSASVMPQTNLFDIQCTLLLLLPSKIMHSKEFLGKSIKTQ